MKKLTILILALACTTAIAWDDKDERFFSQKTGPDVFEEMSPTAAQEVELAEEVIQKRLNYRNQLEKIKQFYMQVGNQLKLEWVERELSALNSSPRYRYILEAEVAGSSLAANDVIPQANMLYDEAVKLYDKADFMGIIKSKKKMRLVLNKLNELISKYPTCDKIDDAAYMAGKIHEFFKDYSIAVLYYKRAFQWNSDNPYPARYKAARLYDYQLAERDKALQLYRESLEKEKLYDNYKEIIEQRITELTAEADSYKIK